MSFNFGSLANTPTTSGIAYLKPYDIYNNVGIESTEIKEGTSEKGNSWKCLKVTFKSPEGVYTESIWYPKDGDDERREVETKNGGKRLMASNFEVTMALVAAIGHAFNPEGFKKLQEKSKAFRSFDDVTNGLMIILNKAKEKGVKTSMKLVGRTTADGRVYARLPQPLGITQDKETKEWYTFPVAIFGDNLTFSAYEQGQAEAYHKATPTAVGNTKVDTDSVNNFDTLPSDQKEVDFDDLIAEL